MEACDTKSNASVRVPNARRRLAFAACLAFILVVAIALLVFALPRVLPDQTIARIPAPSLVARAWETNLERGGNVATGRRRLFGMGARARDAVKGLARSKMPAVRAEAYSLLGEIGGPEVGEEIAAGIDDANWRVRRGAVIGLGYLAAARYSPVLTRAFRKESKAELRVLIVLAAGRSGGVIHEAKSDPDWAVRRAYVEVLARNQRETFLQGQSDLFSDADPRVRRAVASHSIQAGSSPILPGIAADLYRLVRETAGAASHDRDTVPNWPNSPVLQEFTVSTLADAGAGSLRWAIERPGPRRIRFAVHGKIALTTYLVVREPYLVIDGTDAPREGVELLGYPLVLRGTHHVEIRGISISRIGDDGDIDPEYGDALSVNAGTLPWTAPYYDGEDAVTADVVVEHCSLLDAIDENLEVYQEGTGVPLSNVLVRKNLIAFGKHKSIHPKGDHSRGLLMGQNLVNVRIEDNVFLNNGGRNPFASLSGYADVTIARNIVRGWTEQGIGIEALPAETRTGAVRIEDNVLVLDTDRQSPFDFQGNLCLSPKQSGDGAACAPGAVDVRLSSNAVIRAAALRDLAGRYRRTIAEAGWPIGAGARWFPEIRE